MKIKGQNLIEFGIILGLVVIVAIGVFTVFGNNIKAMFTESNKVASTYKPFDWGNNNSNSSVNPFNSGSNQTSGTLDGYKYDSLPDGKVSLNIANQTVIIDQKIIEAAGSSGLGDEIAYMIQKHKAEYGGEDVPVEVIDAESNRIVKDISITGEVQEITEANPTTVIRVGDHLIMLQNENACEKDGNSCKEKDASKLEGDFRIEGDIITKGGREYFEGEVIRTDRVEEKIAQTEANIAEAEKKNDQKKLDKELEKLEKLKDERENAKPVTISSKIDTQNGLKIYDTRISGDMDDLKKKDMTLWEIEF